MKLSCRIMLNSLDRRRRERNQPWSDAPPHGHAAWRGARSTSAAFSTQNANGNEYRQGRSDGISRSRSKVSRSGAFGRQSRAKAQASRPRIHGALSLLSPFARLIRHPTTAARQCEPRDVLAATHAAASRPERNRTPRATPSTLFRKERRFVFPEKENEPFTFETVRGMPAPLSEPSR